MVHRLGCRTVGNPSRWETTSYRAVRRGSHAECLPCTGARVRLFILRAQRFNRFEDLHNPIICWLLEGGSAQERNELSVHKASRSKDGPRGTVVRISSRTGISFDNTSL